jgi:Arc/MetJ family transcription regulator
VATNLGLDDNLIEEALKVGGYKSKKDTVNAALAEFIQHRRRLAVIDAFGTFDFDEAYDYKQERRARDAKLGLLS